jgi:tRNA (guanine-N7-)-methyltransferase
MAGAYPALALDLDQPPPPTLADLFPVAVDEMRLEIGFGGGEHLVAEALAAPAAGFIGVEPFVAGMAKAVSAVSDRAVRNIRLHDGDAVHLLDWLPPGTLTRVDLLYPDPWPKRRHFKRRFVSPDNLGRIARVLVPGGTFRVASDIDAYIAWTLAHLLRRSDFAWTAESADDWRTPFPGWPGTRYEAKALREGRRPTYLEFRRL